MCDTIRFNTEADVSSVHEFQEKFQVDAMLYGWDGNKESLNCCMCDIDLERFFKDHPQHNFVYGTGDWWQSSNKETVK